MPITFVTFGAGYLAIIGIPPFAGFFSKDKIIEAALADNIWIGLAAILGAGITAFYMSRVMFMTFFGEKRWANDAHPHESPGSMTIPMVVLAIGSVVLGCGARHRWHASSAGSSPLSARRRSTSSRSRSWPSPAIIVAVTLVGVALAYAMYLRRPVPVEAPIGSVLTRAARQDFYQDAFNESLFMRPGQYLTQVLGLLRQPDRRRLRQRFGGHDRWRIVTPATLADRVCALLRAVHAGRGRTGRRCSRTGGALT